METSREMQEQIASFVDIVGESIDKARKFLQATNWNLDEAVQLFYAQSDSHEIESDYVRPALPIQREALYDNEYIQSRDQQSAHWSSQPNSAWAFSNGDDQNKNGLEELYRPPFELMFKGSFEQAKSEASGQGKWLIVNIQSTKQFSSYTLNSDTWANQAVKETLSANFIFWQIYDDNEEGRKVCGYYHLTEMPSTLVIDSITGQKMQVWSRMIKPERLLEDLLPYMDKGPMEFSHSRRRVASNVNETHEQVEGNASSASASLDIKQDNPVLQVEGNVLSASASLASLDIKEDDQEKVVKPHDYPILPDEPQGDRVNICRVAVRFPDGKRLQRRFLHTDSLQLLWSFCCNQVKEAADGRQFRLARAIPGATTGTLEYDSDLSFGESGLSNSLISMTWE